MSTSNFHNVNASKIYSCEDEFDDLKLNLLSELNSNDNKLKGFDFTFDEKVKDSHELRSYPSAIIATSYLCRNFKNFEVTVYIDVIVRIGYYYDCNLDYNIRYECLGQEVEIPKEFDEVFEYQLDTSIKNARRINKYVTKWCLEARKQLTDYVENVFNDISSPLNVVGTFSNGETIYTKA